MAGFSPPGGSPHPGTVPDTGHPPTSAGVKPCRERPCRGLLRGALGVSLAGRCMARLRARTAGATYISKGGKGLGRGMAKGGTSGVSWHRGCAPLHTT
jgi:hypothetical protein